MPLPDEPSTADRVKYLLSSYFRLAVAACLVLAAGGLVVAVDAHSGPDTTTEQRTVGTWTSDSHFEHAAVAQQDTLTFDRGTVLRNRTTYFSYVTPVLNGSYVYEYEGDAEPTSVRTDLRFVVRAVDPSDEGRVLWRDSEHMTTRETDALGPEETHRVPFEVNVTAGAEFARAVQEELRTNRGSIEILVVADTRAETTLEGEDIVDTRTERLEATPGRGTYAVAANVSGQESEGIQEPVEVPVESDPVREYGSLAVLLVGLLGCAGLVSARRRGHLDVDRETRTAIRLRSDRDSFGEWISTGRVPPADENDRVVVVDSLADLVDVAIDTDRRVLEDANSGAFVVLDGANRYEYRPEHAPDASILPESGSATSGRAGITSLADDDTEGSESETEPGVGEDDVDGND